MKSVFRSPGLALLICAGLISVGTLKADEIPANPDDGVNTEDVSLGCPCPPLPCMCPCALAAPKITFTAGPAKDPCTPLTVVMDYKWANCKGIATIRIIVTDVDTNKPVMSEDVPVTQADSAQTSKRETVPNTVKNVKVTVEALDGTGKVIVSTTSGTVKLQ